MKSLEKLIIDAQIITESEAEVERVMQVCNACRYCEGLRRVSGHDPAPGLAADLKPGHLCHDCGACLHACQYAPPTGLPLMSRRRWRKCAWRPINTMLSPRLCSLYRVA